MAKQSAYFAVPGLEDGHTVKKIKRSVGGLPGVLSVSADAQGGRIAVDYDSTGTNVHEIEDRVRGTGVGAELIRNEDHTM